MTRAPKARRPLPGATSLPLDSGLSFEPAPEVAEHPEGTRVRKPSKATMEKLCARVLRAQYHYAGPTRTVDRSTYPVPVFWVPAGEHRLVLENGRDKDGPYLRVEAVPGKVRDATKVRLPHYLYSRI